MGEPTLNAVLAALHRLEHKVDVLIVALATEEEPEDEEAQTLDGQSAGGERDPNQTL